MNKKIAVIGLGYVGLPLAVEFSKKYITIGYDINKERVSNLLKFIDDTNEIDKNEIKNVLNHNIADIGSKREGLFLTNNICDIKQFDYYIITVPTPLDDNKRPDLRPLEKASEAVGSILKRGNYVVYESTVYPGLTEEVCVPILEKKSGLKFNIDFFVGYSPERINPGDKQKKLTEIIKVTSGSNPDAAKTVDNLYKSIISAGTHLAPSIKVAEAAKIIENSQRDINIAFVNELSKIFGELNIDTYDVLKAAGTKWNFLNFTPGLVGGHCIGVDPYYLAQKAQQVGYHPEIILSGRRLNDGMPKYVASQIIKLMLTKSIKILNSEILFLGFTFKENCPDIRNSRVYDVYNELKSYNTNIDIYDPIANSKQVIDEYNISLIAKIQKKYDAVVLLVAHSNFNKLDYGKLTNSKGIIYDVKGFLDSSLVDGRL